jgi:hypothetical protein
LHDAADDRAAQRVRQELASAGWQESAGADTGAKAVLLLTNRTGSDWLLAQQPRLADDVLTVVATSICLPPQLDWLWKREWIDLRGWDLALTYRAEALPQVPEAVTQPHFPAAVRAANHLMCALSALTFVLLVIANPEALNNSQQPPLNQMLGLIGGAALIVMGIEVARRLLRRTMLERTFYRGAWIVWLGAVVFAGAALIQGIKPPALFRMLPVTMFLVAFPFALMRTRAPLAFWFPASSRRSQDKARTLAGNRIWRTFWWLVGYLLLWGWVLGTFN